MSLTYMKIGSGPPLVFVHGLAGSNRWWARNSRVLSTEFTVYLVDLPGRRGEVSDEWPLEDLVATLPAWMDEMPFERVHLVGHSLGGYISLHLAATQPERVRRLALIDSVGVPIRTTTLGMMRRVIRGIPHGSPSFIPTVVQDGLRMGAPTLLRLTREILAVDARPLLRQIEAPTLVLWGTRDTVLPPKLGMRMADLIPNASFHLIPRAGHNAMADRPVAVNRHLRGFFESGEVPADMAPREPARPAPADERPESEETKHAPTTS